MNLSMNGSIEVIDQCSTVERSVSLVPEPNETQQEGTEKPKSI
jgi:hypothetical protein